MRFLLTVCIVVISIAGTAQKKNKRKNGSYAVPETQQDSLALEALLIDAEKHLILENDAKALESFIAALDKNTQSGAINFKISQLLAKTADGQKALPYGLKAIELDPNNKYYRISLARIYQSVGFYIEATKTYEALLEKFPADENALYELAELYQISGQTDKMLATFDKIEKQLGVKEEIIREKQRVFMKQGKIDEVVKEYQKLSKAYPNESAFRLEMISFLIQNERLEEAEAAIKQYESGDTSNARILLLKSELAWIKKEHEKSLSLLKEAFSSPSIDFETKFQIVSNYLLASTSQTHQTLLTDLMKEIADQYRNEFRAQAFVGDLLYQNGNKQTAVAYYLRAITLKPANFNVWQNILNVDADLGWYDSLVVHAERALEYFPNQALLYYFAGTGHSLMKNHRKAVQVLEIGKNYTTDPNLLTVFFGQLGDAYNGLQESVKSYNAYDKALENKPDNDHVLNNYSYFLSLENKNMDKALQMSTSLVEKFPNNATYLDTHGWVLYVGGNYKEAKKHIEKAVMLDATNGEVLEHYGDVLFKLGDTNEALVQWEKARLLGGASDLLEKKIADKKLYE